MLCDPYQNPLINIENISFSYDGDGHQKLLNNISFSIREGEFFCLLGASGCGKTTLLRMISGLQNPQSGQIIVNGNTQKKNKIGMVFQDLALFSHMTVAKNVGFSLRHLSRTDRRARIDEMLDLVGLTEKRRFYPHELSGGQKQRLAIARALAPKPDIILLDEPFLSQDLNLRTQIRDDIMHILRESGVAALLVTHDPEEAMQFADRIAILKDGKIEQLASPHKIYNDPATPYVAAYFGQANHFYGVVEGGGVTTDVGFIPLDGETMEDGQKVHIIARPEAFRLNLHDVAVDHNHPDHHHTHANIAESKYLGRSTLIHMDVVNLDAKTHGSHIHVRVPGIHKINKHAIHDVYLDHSQIFIFQDNDAL